MHTRMPSRSSQRNATGGIARALADHAIAAASSANGNANSVWLKRISSRRWRSTEGSGVRGRVRTLIVVRVMSQKIAGS